MAAKYRLPKALQKVRTHDRVRYCMKDCDWNSKSQQEPCYGYIRPRRSSGSSCRKALLNTLASVQPFFQHDQGNKKDIGRASNCSVKRRIGDDTSVYLLEQGNVTFSQQEGLWLVSIDKKPETSLIIVLGRRVSSVLC
jgi:hypothetical protein